MVASAALGGWSIFKSWALMFLIVPTKLHDRTADLKSVAVPC